MPDNSLGKFFRNFRKRIKDTIEDIKNVLENDLEDEARAVAAEIEAALNEIIAEIQRDSRTGALDGYSAVAERVDNPETFRMSRSGERLSARVKWIVKVTGPGDDNIFNILDGGRPSLPKRDRPYPLFSNIRDSADNLVTNSRVNQFGRPVAGPNPIQDAVFRGEEGKPPFSLGPIAAVPAMNLYRRARDRARERIDARNLKAWDVVFAGAIE